MSKVINIRCKAFATEGVKTHKIMVDGSSVRVWDRVAGHYTTCHSMSKAAVAKAIAAGK